MDVSSSEVLEAESSSSSSAKKSSFLRKDSAKYTDEVQKRGVIYISRIPPFMKPNRARSIFEQYGEVTRLFLAEEDSSRRKIRKTKGGDGTKQFCEGWIEFEDKSIAKSVAESLNNKSIGTTKGDYYHDDVWNLKYLKNFKWDYLTEKLAYERRVRENKLKVAMMQAKKTNAEFTDLVERNKVENYIQERKKSSSSSSSGSSNNNSNNNENGSSLSGNNRSLNNTNASTSTNDDSTKVKKQKTFKQHRSLGMQHGEETLDKKVLMSILGNKK